MTGETYNKLVAAFLESVEEFGVLPSGVQIIESSYRFKTPSDYPPGPPVREERFAETRRYTVKLPELVLNPSLAEAVKQHPEMEKAYWRDVAHAISDYLEFEVIPG